MLTLTPVIVLGHYHHVNIAKPNFQERSIWSPAWQAYRQECMRLSGMPEPIPPTVPATDFYTLNCFSGDRLEWLIHEHVDEYINEPQHISSFFGGYLLSDATGVLLYPQCCGELSDVMWWKHLCYSQKLVYYNGHPGPDVRFDNGLVHFVCEEEYEPFDPLSKPRFSVPHAELVSAYETMLPQLLAFKNGLELTVDRLKLPNNFDFATALTLRNLELNESDPCN
jgi:hypothetical protein